MSHIESASSSVIGRIRKRSVVIVVNLSVCIIGELTGVDYELYE
jgi:hypothetical protein